MQRGRGGGQRGGDLVGAGRDVLDEDRDHRVDGRVGGDVLDGRAEARRRLGRDELDRAGDHRLGGSTARSAAWVSADRLATSSPASAHASAQTTPGPRALQTIPTPPPRGERLLGEHGGGVQQVVEPVAADHARAGEQRVDGAVATPRSARRCASSPPARPPTSAPP